MKTRVFPLLLAASISASAGAAIISAVGGQVAIGDRIRTTTTPKIHDLDGDNAYGTAGWQFFGVGGGNVEGPGFETQSLIGLPSFISDIAAAPGGIGYYAAYNGYLPIDDPREPIGANVPNVISGLAYVRPVTQAVEYPFFQIIVAEDTPIFRVGFLVNQESAYTQFPNNIRLQCDASVASLAVDATATRGQRDMYFFDVAGAHAGDVIQVFGTAASLRESLGVSGITFDIPTPGTSAIVAALGLLVARRRRR